MEDLTGLLIFLLFGITGHIVCWICTLGGWKITSANNDFAAVIGMVFWIVVGLVWLTVWLIWGEPVAT